MSTTLKTKRTIKSKKIKVVSVCSVCGEPVSERNNGNAYRHGFKRFKLAMAGFAYKKFSQEDGKPCSGSGKQVVYKKK